VGPKRTQGINKLACAELTDVNADFFLDLRSVQGKAQHHKKEVILFPKENHEVEMWLT